MYRYGYRYIDGGYYKELAHAVMKDKSQDLQSASWRPKRADGVGSSPKVSRLKTQEKCFSSSSEAGKKIDVSS